jgi:acyl carrier protein
MELRTELFADVTNLLATRCGVEPATVTEQTALSDDLGLDSLDLIGMAQVLQSKYDVALDNESIASVRTVADVVDFVVERVTGTSRSRAVAAANPTIAER